MATPENQPEPPQFFGRQFTPMLFS